MMNEDQRRKHNDYMLEKVQCPCGTLTARCNMTTHRKTNKHQKWVEQSGGTISLEEYKRMLELIDNHKKNLTARKKY